MLDIQWTPPYSIKEGYRIKWKREWCIPKPMLAGFFDFWKRNRFKMLADGFTVTKSEQSGKWYLIETRDDPALFRVFANDKTPEKPEKIFILPPYELKNSEGLRPWQVGASEKLVAAINQWGCGVDGSELGCHAKGQFILMEDGRTKKVEDIVVGDKVMGWKGPQKVTELFTGRQQMARIVPIKGEPFIVNINHLLTITITNDNFHGHKTTGGYKYGEIAEVRVKDWFNLPKTTKAAMKLISTGIGDLWPEQCLGMPPYVVGALLGDGGLTQRSAITFTSADKEVWAEIETLAKFHGWTFGKWNRGITRTITNAHSLFIWLRRMKIFPIKCEDRFIPYYYKTAGKNQRLEILAGLIDTDGGYYKHGNGYEITLKSKQLSEDIVFVARSLGLAAYFKPCKKKCCNNGVIGNYFRTHISGNVDMIPCRVPRKKATPRKQIKSVLRRGFNIELLPEDDYYGFSLDGDGRFLLGDFTVTHNTGKTYSACATIRELDAPFAVVCPKPVIHQWKKVIGNHFHLNDKFKGIINYELLIRGRTDSKIASFVLSRETKRRKFVWKLPKDTIIIWDEAHRLKNFKTKSSKTCIEADKQGYKQLFLSATLASSPLEMRTVGTCTKIFKNAKEYYTWAYDHGVYKGTWGLAFNNSPKVLKKLHRYLFEERGVRLLRDEIPNFPETEIIVNAYDMDDEDTAKIREIYDEMKKELGVLAMKGKSDSSEMAIRIRALQKAEMLKIPLFEEMIKEALETDMSVVVFLNYSDSVDALANRLSTTCIYDGRNEKTRQANVELFQENKERVLITNIGAAREGLNLQDEGGKHPRLTIISPPYSVTKLKQALGRVHRENSKSKSVQKIVYIADTQEERVVDLCGQKLQNLTLINNGEITDDDLKI
jgi:superfamily II DNA or RNA helicase